MIISIDTEKTGPFPLTDQIVQIGAVVIVKKENLWEIVDVFLESCNQDNDIKKIRQHVLELTIATAKLEGDGDGDGVSKPSKMAKYVECWKKASIKIPDQRTKEEFWDKHPELLAEIKKYGVSEKEMATSFHKFLLSHFADGTKYLSDNPAYDIAGITTLFNFHNMQPLEYVDGKYRGFGIDIDGMLDYAIHLGKDVTLDSPNKLSSAIDIVERMYEKKYGRKVDLKIHNALYDATVNAIKYTNL